MLAFWSADSVHDDAAMIEGRLDNTK